MPNAKVAFYENYFFLIKMALFTQVLQSSSLFHNSIVITVLEWNVVCFCLYVHENVCDYKLGCVYVFACGNMSKHKS